MQRRNLSKEKLNPGRPLDFSNRKVARVAGASRGIGRAIAEALARNNICVFVNFNSKAKEAAEHVGAIRRAGGAREVIRANVSRERRVHHVFKVIAQRAGRLDILGGNIGAHYSASKAALAGFAEYLSRAVGQHRITVNIFEPGFVQTELSASLHRTKADIRAMCRNVPLRRIGTVKNIADGVAFLAGDAAAYITRHKLAITGGR